ncbi:trafficking protein particle complex subunit 8 [Babesia caballi]|uniref:Trafficking protein particle complex subunit 8 n=1 Tax=Babesia caballi TaxID=5871 RepID=A0AAV4LU14_BABCB|nr:trafficking protein particle complex subunit 8 [Babesia caballi]
MGVPVCSQDALFERLARQLQGACMLVKATRTAREKIAAAGFKSCTQLVHQCLESDEKLKDATKLEFEDEHEVAELEKGDYDTHLFNVVADNTPEFDPQDMDFVGYPLWFSEWALTLAKIVRCTRYKAFGIPHDTRGVMAFCTPGDNLEVVVNMLGKVESNTFRAIVVIGEDNSEVLINDLKSTYKEGVNHYVLESDSSSWQSCLKEESFPVFIANMAKVCIAQTRLAITSAKRKKSLPHISSKYSKCEPTDADWEAVRTIVMAINDELHAESALGYIEEACRGTEHEIQGLAYVFSAISHVQKARGSHDSAQKKGDSGKSNPAENIEKAIADLDKAIGIFLKYESKWDALVAAILMATIGGDAEARKLGAISATMELKSKADFVRAALSLELCTFFTQRLRKKVFNLVMAGHVYIQAGLLDLTKRCYTLAVPLYKEKGWSLASDFLYGTLSRYDPLYCIDALNGLADLCEMLNCHVYMKNYDHDFIKSPWYGGDREMTHLRRLMKLSVAELGVDDITHKNASASVCCAYGPYPSLLCGTASAPPLGDSVPYLVRVPLVFQRNKEGVPGKNSELLVADALCAPGGEREEATYNTADDVEQQEAAIGKQVKARAAADASWKPCYEFISDYGNISYRVDANSEYSLPKQPMKPAPHYFLGADSVIKLELVNPLHIGIHCDEFHILVTGQDESWWEKAAIVTVEAGSDNRTQSKGKDNFVYLSEGERRHVYLKFRVEKPRVFNVAGVAWKLFGCVSCWVPLFVCGQRKTKGAPLCNQKAELLDEYISDRLSNAALSLSIRDTRPQLAIALSKVTQLPSNALPLNEQNEHYKQVNQYISTSDSEGSPMFEEGGHLSMEEAIAGELVITRVSMKNTGASPIESVTLNVKTSGECHVTNYPMAYVSQAGNVRVVWEDMAKCNLGSVTGNKAYQVTLQDDTGNLIAPDGTLSIYMLAVPSKTESKNVLCIQGRLKASSGSYNTDAVMAFWRFYVTGDGVTVSYDYDHSLPDMLQCTVVNNSKKDVEAIGFYDSNSVLLQTQIRGPNLLQPAHAIGLRKNTRLSSVMRFNPEDSMVTLRWECKDALGLVTSRIDIDPSARVLLKVTSEKSSITYAGVPLLVRVEFVFENPTAENIPSMRVEAIPNTSSDGIHGWFYVGVLIAEVPPIPPYGSGCIGFDVLLPRPGMYFFTHSNISITPARAVSITPCEQLMISVEG